jgi:hypothetical protein
MTTRFTPASRGHEHVEGAPHIDLEVQPRILDGFDHAGVGREMDDGVASGGGAGERGRIANVALVIIEPDVGQIPRRPHALIVEHDELVGAIPLDDRPDQVRSDESAASRNQGPGHKAGSTFLLR